jgi:hypothetical protein
MALPNAVERMSLMVTPPKTFLASLNGFVDIGGRQWMKLAPVYLAWISGFSSGLELFLYTRTQKKKMNDLHVFPAAICHVTNCLMYESANATIHPIY